MAEWRLGTGWTEAELEERLAAVARGTLNFSDSPEEMIPEHGWNHVRSFALIGREPPGLALAEGPFARAREAVERFEFSDPRIVVGHFDRDVALDRRLLLLELKSAGLRFLCPVQVGGVRDEVHDGCTTFGYSFETLRGHVESGREWFLLTKDHATGEIRFKIAAAWRSGDFPNAWSYVGFQLLGRRYQRAWHRLCHLRLRHVLAGHTLHAPEGPHLVHSGEAIASMPVQFHARRAQLRYSKLVEYEGEALRGDRIAKTIAWSWLAGMRSAAPHAFLTAIHPPMDPALSALVPATKLFALAELAADKAPFMPNRTSPLAMVGRAMSGGLVGYTLARRGHRMHSGALAVLGAGTALVSTAVTFGWRKRLSRHVPGVVAGLIEDAVVLTAGALLSRRAHTSPRPVDADGIATETSEDAQRELGGGILHRATPAV